MPPNIIEVTPSRSTQFYVSPTGSNSASGLNHANPTNLNEMISRINSGSAQFLRDANGNATVNLANGTYAIAAGLSLSGLLDVALKFQGATGVGEESLISVAAGSSFVFQAQNSFLEIDGITIDNGDSDGIRAVFGAYVIVKNLGIRNIYSDLIFADQAAQMLLQGTFDFKQDNIDMDSLLRSWTNSIIQSDAVLYKFNSLNVNCAGAWILSNRQGRIHGENNIFENKQNTTGRTFQARDTQDINLNLLHPAALNSILPGDSYGTYAISSTNEITPPSSDFGSRVFPIHVAFKLAPNTFRQILIGKTNLEPRDFVGNLVANGVNGNDYLYARFMMYGAFSNALATHTPPSGTWRVWWNGNQDAIGVFAAFAGLIWFNSGTLNGSNGTANAINISRSGTLLYINNRTSQTLDFLLDWRVTYFSTAF